MNEIPRHTVAPVRPTTTFSPGDRVRVVDKGIFHGDVGVVTAVGGSIWPVTVQIEDGTTNYFEHDDLEPLPALHDALVEAEGTGGTVQITGPDWRGTFGPLQDPTDPTSTPDDPDRPVGEVIDVVPGALVRQPAGSRRADCCRRGPGGIHTCDAPSSSQAGLQAHVPLRTVPPQAARDLMAGAGIDMEGFDRALAQAREGAEEHADRPVLAAYDDGHAQGHRDGQLRAIRLLDQHIAKAEARDHRVLTAALVEIVGELRAEVAR